MREKKEEQNEIEELHIKKSGVKVETSDQPSERFGARAKGKKTSAEI